MKITTPKEWWACADAHKEELFSILASFLPLQEPAHEEPGRGASPLRLRRNETLLTGYEDVMYCFDAQDHERLHTYLYGAWDMAPDNPRIHNIRGWSVLCDLLSEDWVFEPQEQRHE